MTDKVLLTTVHADGHVTYEYDPSLTRMDELCALMDLRVATHRELQRKGQEYQEADRQASRPSAAPLPPFWKNLFCCGGKTLLVAACVYGLLFSPPILDLNGDGVVDFGDVAHAAHILKN